MLRRKEAGYWVLRCDNLHVYAVTGGDWALRREGQEVNVTGELVGGPHGLAPASGLIYVQSYEVLAPPASP